LSDRVNVVAEGMGDVRRDGDDPLDPDSRRGVKRRTDDPVSGRVIGLIPQG